MTTPRALLPWALGLTMLGCHASEPVLGPDPVPDAPVTAAASPTQAPPEATELRTYETPPGRAAEVASVLHRVLRGSDDAPPRGTVTAARGDRVVVVAPLPLHEGIAELCRDLARTTTAPRSVTLQYWLVRADPAEASDASAVPSLATTLEEVARADGPARFSLVERVELASLLDASGRAEGSVTRVQQVASAQENTILADVDIELDPPRMPSASLHSRVRLSPGDTVVIGQSGWPDDATREGASDEQPRLYYVVRAELDDVPG